MTALAPASLGCVTGRVTCSRARTTSAVRSGLACLQIIMGRRGTAGSILASVRSGEGGDGVDVEPPPCRRGALWPQRDWAHPHAGRTVVQSVSVSVRDLGWVLSAAGGPLGMGGPPR